MYFGEITDSDIIWKKVNDSQSMGYFHSGSFGDFNGDGNFDVVGVSGTPPNGQKSFFSSSNNGDFSLFEHKTPLDGFDFDFSAELYDLDQDGKDEIISRTSDGITSYKYNSESNKFEISFNTVVADEPPPPPAGAAHVAVVPLLVKTYAFVPIARRVALFVPSTLALNVVLERLSPVPAVY